MPTSLKRSNSATSDQMLPSQLQTMTAAGWLIKLYW